MTRFGIIFAHDEEYGFSKDNSIPWKCSEDLTYFKNMTKGYPVIMGRKTYESLPFPLPDRENIVISSVKHSDFNSYTLQEAFDYLEITGKPFAWVIGGTEIIRIFIEEYFHLVDVMSVSKINGYYFCDQPFLYIFPVIGTKITINVSENFTLDYWYRDKKYNIYDALYLKSLASILQCPVRSTRNGETRSRFGETIRFNNITLEGFPILSTKRIYWKGIVEELLFFLSGKTDTKELEKRNVKIWTGNTSKEFLEAEKKDYREGDMGPMYGFQLKHYGEKYEGCDKEYPEVNQLRHVIDLLVKDPHSRRILLTTYNYKQASEGVLYPCHGIVTQFYVENSKISLCTYQRSADWFLGVPFNISSYALLLYIIVFEVNKLSDKKYICGDLIFNFGDVHLYNSHLVPALKQLAVIPNLNENSSVSINSNFDIHKAWDFTSEDFLLENYIPGPLLKAEMIA